METECSSLFKGRLFLQSGLIRLALDPSIDCIIYLGNAQHPSTWLSAAIARSANKRVLFWTHGWTKTDAISTAIVRRAFYRIAHGLLLYGDAAKRKAMAEGIPRERLYVVHNSLDYRAQEAIRNSLPVDSASSVRQELFGQDAFPLVVFTGRLVKSARVELLLQAWKRLDDAGKAPNLIVIGDGPEREHLQQLVPERGRGKVLFFGACYDEAVLGRIVSAADVSVLPGKAGLAVMHSLAYGTPVLTHDRVERQMPEWEAIIPETTGGLFEEGNPVSLAEAIDRWTRHHHPARDLCWKLVEKYFSPQFQVVRIERAVSGLPAEDTDWPPNLALL